MKLRAQSSYLLFQSSKLPLQLSSALLECALLFLTVGQPLNSFFKSASHLLDISRELLNFEFKILLRVCDVDEVGLDHSQRLEFSLLLCGLHLPDHILLDLANFALQFL